MFYDVHKGDSVVIGQYGQNKKRPPASTISCQQGAGSTYYIFTEHRKRGVHFQSRKATFQPFFTVRPGVLTRGVQSRNCKKSPIYGLSEGVHKY